VLGVSLSGVQKTVRPTTVVVTERKTVADLLQELDLSRDHVVLSGGRRLSLDDIVDEDDTVVILPLITGG